MSDDAIDAIRARDEALPRDLVSAGYGQAHEDRRALLAALDASQREAERLRGQLTAMHRRAQRAEGIADRVAADRPQGAHGRSYGRALANYAAHRAAQERDEARAEAERLRADLAAETERADTGHRQIAARAEEARAYAERMRDRAAQARRAALEEAIAACGDVERRLTYGAPIARLCADAVRALLDAPAVRPAPPSASEET